MSNLRNLIAAALVFALAAASGTLSAEQTLDATPAAQMQSTSVTGETIAYKCCWIYHAGRWYCLPC